MEPMTDSPALMQGSIWAVYPEPDVWWGSDGIDALIWADPKPYELSISEPPAETAASPIAVETVL
jgi:hypothetical protein